MSIFRNMKFFFEDVKDQTRDVKMRWDAEKEDLKNHIKSGPNMLRSVKEELKHDVGNATRELFNQPTIERKGLKKGDIIGVGRGLYEHLGIYIGKGRAIHFTSFSSDKSLNNTVMETSMSEFMRGATHFFIVDEKALSIRLGKNPYSVEETIRRAKRELGKGEYKLIVNNCEHFAFWCKFGVKYMEQGIGRVTRSRYHLAYPEDLIE